MNLLDVSKISKMLVTFSSNFKLSNFQVLLGLSATSARFVLLKTGLRLLGRDFEKSFRIEGIQTETEAMFAMKRK